MSLIRSGKEPLRMTVLAVTLAAVFCLLDVGSSFPQNTSYSRRSAVDKFGRERPLARAREAELGPLENHFQTHLTDPALAVPEGILKAANSALAPSGLFLPYTYYIGGSFYSIYGHIEAVGIGDFDSDGRNDVVLATGMNDRSVEPPISMDDVENDNKLFLFYQNSDGGLDPPVKYETSFYFSYRIGHIFLAVGDVNGDGKADVVLGNAGESLEVFLQAETGGLLRSVIYPTGLSWWVHVVDLDGDGLEEVVSEGVGQLGVWKQRPDGMLAPPVTYKIDDRDWGNIAFGDLNHDGRLDMALRSRGGYGNPYFGVMLQESDGNFAPPAYYTVMVDFGTSGIAVGDLNGDGRDDVSIIWGGNNFSAPADDRPKVGVFFQNEAGTLNDVVEFPTYDIPMNLRAADVNGDNRMDLVLEHEGWEAVGVYLQGPDGQISPEELYRISHQQTDADTFSVGDINNDGWPDLVIGNTYHRWLEIVYHAPEGNVPSIRVTSPNGGEKLQPGTIQNITWTSTGDVGNVRIDYSLDGGVRYFPVAESLPNTGSLAWTVPEVGAKYGAIRVYEVLGRVWDTNDEYFTLEGCKAGTFTVTSFYFSPESDFRHLGLTVGPQCKYQSSTTSSWITASSGSVLHFGGYDLYGYSVAANPSRSSRTGTITVNETSFSIYQEGLSIKPVITEITGGSALPGEFRTPITVRGRNFVRGSALYLGDYGIDTVFVSDTELRAVVPRARFPLLLDTRVRVWNGVFSDFFVQSAAGITRLSPRAAVAGGDSFALTVIGENFESGAVVQWNRQNRRTTFVSSTSLRAVILGTDIAAPGTASIRVLNPGDDESSDAAAFRVSRPAVP